MCVCFLKTRMYSHYLALLHLWPSNNYTCNDGTYNNNILTVHLSMVCRRAFLVYSTNM